MSLRHQVKTECVSLSDLSKNALKSRAVFDCGQPSLNEYVSRQASQHEKKGIARTFCSIQEGRIIGFYSLTSSEVDVSALKPELTKKYKLPSHLLPVVRLARLAVDQAYQGAGIGGAILIDAMAKVVNVARNAGCVGLIVDAIDTKAAEFYLGYGFQPSPDNPFLLFMALPEIKELFED